MRWLREMLWATEARAEVRRQLEEARQAREVTCQQLADIEWGLARQRALRAEIQAQLVGSSSTE